MVKIMNKNAQSRNKTKKTLVISQLFETERGHFISIRNHVPSYVYED